ncbi:MAG: hypothetical protein KAG99_07005 [Bacteroidales bacterium]|nr:hypothetical protein [Bacteroidales bacterium]
MIKRLLALFVLSVFLVSCGTNSGPVNEEKAAEAEIPVLSIADFEDEAENYIGENVIIEGTVVHVCQHGGKRMFLIGEDPDVRIKVTVGNDISSFEVELEGSDVVVYGFVDELRIDEDYLVQWEAELAEESEMTKEEEGEEGEEHQGQHTGLGEQADQGEHVEALVIIQDYRDQIAASEKGYLSFLSVVCNKFEEKQDESDIQ